MCHPSNLRGESFHVIRLFLKQILRNQHWQIDVLHSRLFKSFIQIRLNILPDRIAIRQIVQTSLHTGIVAELRLSHHIRIPLSKIFLSGCDGLYKFLVVLCHITFSSQSIYFSHLLRTSVLSNS